jgi:hypothetical protein
LWAKGCKQPASLFLTKEEQIDTMADMDTLAEGEDDQGPQNSSASNTRTTHLLCQSSRNSEICVELGISRVETAI